jgi:MFS family permease
MYASGGVGSLFLAPILQKLIDKNEWQSAWLVLSFLAAAVTLPVTILVKKEPGQIGLKPLGENEVAASAKAETLGLYQAPRSHTLKEAFMSTELWMLNFCILLAMAGILAAQQNMVPYATDKGMTTGIAALALGLASGFNAFGRLAMGFISDRIGTRQALILTFSGAAMVLFYLMIVDRGWMLILFAIVFGFVYGSTIPLMARAVAELFGTDNMGAIMGVAGIFAAIGPAFGPALAAASYDQTGNYSLAFMIAGMAMLISLVLSIRLKLPRKEKPAV